MVEKADRNQIVDSILAGAIDLNVLAGPEPTGTLRFDALDTARYAQEAGMGGFLLLNDYYPTGAQAQMLNRVYPGLTAYGAVTLNEAVGGVNAKAVDAAAGSGARAVLMPTIDAAAAPDAAESVSRAAEAVLDSAARHDIIVMSGGLSHKDALAMFEDARSRGVNHMVLSQSASCVDSCKHGERAAAIGAYVEHTFLACMPAGGGVSPRRLALEIRAATVEASVLTSGFGQWQNPPPAEGLRMAVAALLDEGLTPSELETLVKRNPARLIKCEDQ